MKWYKPDVDEIIFKGTEVLFENKSGIVTNHPQVKYNIPVCFKSNGAYDGWNLTKDELLLKALDESDLIQLGWKSHELFNNTYVYKDWTLIKSNEYIVLRSGGINPDEMEFTIKNKQQLKLLMQFLNIAN